jgi:hypothetical protein
MSLHSFDMPTHSIPITASDLIAYDRWLESLPISPATGWRWRKRGLIETINIYGRVYVSRSAIAEFEARAAAGEFAREHKTPKRSGTQ